MKNIILFLIFLIPLCIFTQDIIDVKSRKTNEVFQAHRKNKAFKDGTYTKYFERSKRKKKEISGYYSNNEKDSIWSYYEWNGILYKKGRFKKGLKNGIWEYFNENGILIHKFNHSENKLLYYTEKQDANIDQSNDFNKNKDIKGLVLGGDRGFHRYIGREFRYPQKAQLYNISGKVLVNFYVDENFQKSDFTITNNPGYGIGNEAIRLIKEGPLFIPPTKDGKFTKVRLSIPITFEQK